jgi:hypothetical protein
VVVAYIYNKAGALGLDTHLIGHCNRIPCVTLINSSPAPVTNGDKMEAISHRQRSQSNSCKKILEHFHAKKTIGKVWLTAIFNFLHLVVSQKNRNYWSTYTAL